MSTLRDHVGHVFRVRSKEQVARVDARRVIAVMKNVFAFRDRTVVKFPGNPTRLSTSVPDLELSVPILECPSGPRPANLSDTNMDEGEESFDERSTWSNRLGAPFRAADHDSVPRREWSLARRTRLVMLSDSHDDSFQSLRSGSRSGARTPPRSEVITTLVGRRAA